jgi:hypothetical protein
MKSIIKFNPMTRAVMVIASIAALVTGVTFAALQSQATLTDNTIASGTAGLLINNTENGGDEGATDTGFLFAGVVPGGSASDSHTFTLHNTGTTPMTIKVGMPALPTWTVTPSGTVDNTKVAVNINCTGPTLALADTVQNIWFSNSTMSGTLAPNETAVCSANITMDAAAFTGEKATANNFDLTFTGTSS